jgi:hypothetical protein
MRIVIDIDTTGAGGEDRVRVSTFPAVAEAAVGAATPGTALTANDAGVAAISVGPAPIPEATAEPLASAVTLNALNAGPAPGLAVPSRIESPPTHADGASEAADHDRDSDAPPPCGAAGIQQGRVINAGPAPT